MLLYGAFFMIKNLVVSGCSFTAGYHNNQKPWPFWTAAALGVKCHNIAFSGAGNTYISNSIVDYLEKTQLDPEETVVVVMWSGTRRKDIRVDAEFWKLLDYKFKFKSTTGDDCCYVGSCGGHNAWNSNSDTKRLFEMLYLATDGVSACKDTMMNFINLKNYLQTSGYMYKFTSFYNQWELNRECSDAGEYLLSYYGDKITLYQQLDYTDWFFINENKDGLWEYTKTNKLIAEDNWHPTDQAHRQYAENIVVPNLQEYFK